jgi:hypothetical protein
VNDALPRKRPPGAPQRQWRRPVPEEHINHYPPLVAGAFAASVAIVIGYILTLGFIMAAWLFAAHGSESTLQVLRAAGVAWQVLHSVPIEIGTTAIGVLPWGFLIVPAVILWKVTQWALKSAQPKTAFEFVRVALSISMIYSIFAGLISLVSTTADLGTSLLSSMIHALLVSLTVTIMCIVSYAPSRTIITDALPNLLVSGIRPAFISFGLLFIAGSLLTSVSLILNWEQVRAVTTLMAPGFIDGFFMTLLEIGYLPVVSIWAMSYLLGPGVVLGGGIVNPETANPGALPAFPLLSILPSEPVAFSSYFILIPIFIGVVIYFLTPRQRWSAQGDSIAVALSFVVRWREVVTLLFAVGILSGLIWVVAAASSGPLGTGNLKFIGPVPSQMAMAAITVCGLSALLTLVLPRTVMSFIHCWSNREVKAK